MRLVIAGLGYTGRTLAALAWRRGLNVVAISRADGAAPWPVVRFETAAEVLAEATHLVATAPPDPDGGDPLLAAHGSVLANSTALRWVCYLSSTGVYGDRAGAWVDETTAPAPQTVRAKRRLAAERQWEALAPGVAVDLFRLAGIYGPGRSAFDELRAGRSRPIAAPGHCFGRIHVEDIAGAVLAAAARPPEACRVLHGADDVPAPSADVIGEAARLLGMAPPPARPLAEAWPDMSEMARSFWSENRRVRAALTQARLDRRWTYPSYREGLAAILAAERGV